MAVSSTPTSTAGAVLSVEDMLANSKAAAASATSDSSKSKIQQMLAGRDPGDTVELSPVAKQLATKVTAKAKESFFDSDIYLNAKVAQLKGQIALYSTLPGLDPSGGVLDSITDEVNKLVNKQKAKLKESTDAAAVKQKELDEQNKNNYKGVTSESMLSRSKSLAVTGKLPEDAISPEAQKLLDKIKGGNVNTTA